MNRALTLTLALLGGGCAAPAVAPPVSPVAPAHLVIENRTPYTWRLRLGATDLAVGPRAMVSRDLPAGRYDAVQERIGSDPRPPPARHLQIDLTAGRTYHWPIATLLTP